MSIRSTIILLAVPLFIMLALVNGALLYYQEGAELERGLTDQTMAAAVTVAEFAKEMDDPRAQLAEPVRARAIAAAVERVEGLDGLVLIESGKPAIVLAPAAAGWDVGALIAPTQATTSRPSAGADGLRRITSRVPAGDGRFVAARIDAEPIFARLAQIQRDILLIVALAAIFAAALGWFVARRITGELRTNGQALESLVTDKSLPAASNLRIREAQDLADAVGLMESSRNAADLRAQRVMARRGAGRDELSALKQARAELFAPRTLEAGSVHASARICGDAPLGSFFAVAETGDGGAVVVGRCNAETDHDALALASAASQFIEDNLADKGVDACVALACKAFAVAEIEIFAWRDDGADTHHPQIICIAENDEADSARTFAEKCANSADGTMLDALDVLIAPTGVFAAVSSASSGQGSAGAGDVVLDDKDAAEPADIKDFAH